MSDIAISTGGSAFPSHGAMGEVAQEGMTLRDYFAGQALSAMEIKDDSSYSKIDFSHDFPSRNAANHAVAAYRIADAMIAARGHK